MIDGRRGWARRIWSDHAAVVVLVAVASLVRLMMWLAYRPGLTYHDSWTYIDEAFASFPVGLGDVRPSGYPLLLRIFQTPVRDMAIITAVQHVAGVITGVVVYSVLRRLSVNRVITLVATGVVLLDAYPITVEQYLLAEAFFTVAVVVSIWLVVVHGDDDRAIALSGGLLAFSVLIRGVALVAIPFWFLYVMWRRRGAWRSVVVLAIVVVVPLGLYGMANLAKRDTFGLSAFDGWWLYGRVAASSDCRGADVPTETRALCGADNHPSDDPDFYVWSSASPARKLFGRPDPESNALLRRFAISVAVANPGRFGVDVLDDLWGYFEPGGRGAGTDVRLPSAPSDPVAGDAFPEAVRDRYYADYDGAAVDASGPARWYHERMRVPRPIWGIVALVCLAGTVVGGRRRKEIVLIGGSALAMLVMPVLTVNLGVRYLIAVIPVLVMAAALTVAAVAERSSPVAVTDEP